MSMSLASIHVGMPREVVDDTAAVSTGIFKQRVTGPVKVGWLNLAGDGQADLVNHGGESKAVYAYPLDHYPWWREALGRPELVAGDFGENLSIRGMDEAAACVGDRLRIGSAEFIISQPRVPCFKLGIRLGDREMPRRFAQSLRTGCYLRVVVRGVIEAEDRVERIAHGEGQLSIRTLFEAYLRPHDPGALALLARAVQVPGLSPEWRAHILRRLAQRESDVA